MYTINTIIKYVPNYRKFDLSDYEYILKVADIKPDVIEQINTKQQREVKKEEKGSDENINGISNDKEKGGDDESNDRDEYDGTEYNEEDYKTLKEEIEEAKQNNMPNINCERMSNSYKCDACIDMFSCFNCSHCELCTRSSYCDDSSNLYRCVCADFSRDCRYSTNLKYCNQCKHSDRLKKCGDCNLCVDCLNCYGCKECFNCINCIDCTNCKNCFNCIGINGGENLNFRKYTL